MYTFSHGFISLFFLSAKSKLIEIWTAKIMIFLKDAMVFCGY